MPDLSRLADFLGRVPATKVFLTSKPDVAPWWVSLELDIDAPVVWNVIQELAYVCNGLSLSTTLPVVFKPVSPPPYLNGGPRDFLMWRIEALTHDASPDVLADYLEGRLPQPVDDLSRWGDKDVAVPRNVVEERRDERAKQRRDRDVNE